MSWMQFPYGDSTFCGQVNAHGVPHGIASLIVGAQRWTLRFVDGFPTGSALVEIGGGATLRHPPSVHQPTDFAQWQVTATRGPNDEWTSSNHRASSDAHLGDGDPGQRALTLEDVCRMLNFDRQASRLSTDFQLASMDFRLASMDFRLAELKAGQDRLLHVTPSSWGSPPREDRPTSVLRTIAGTFNFLECGSLKVLMTSLHCMQFDDQLAADYLRLRVPGLSSDDFAAMVDQVVVPKSMMTTAAPIHDVVILRLTAWGVQYLEGSNYVAKPMPNWGLPADSWSCYGESFAGPVFGRGLGPLTNGMLYFEGAAQAGNSGAICYTDPKKTTAAGIVFGMTGKPDGRQVVKSITHLDSTSLLLENLEVMNVNQGWIQHPECWKLVNYIRDTVGYVWRAGSSNQAS